MLPLKRLNEIRKESSLQAREFFSHRRISRHLTMAFLIAAPFPVYNFIFTYDQLLNSRLAAMAMVSAGLVQIFLYAVCMPSVFRILTEKESSVSQTLHESARAAPVLFNTCLMMVIALGLVVQAVHTAARLYVGLSPWGRLFEGNRLWIAAGDTLAFMLATDFLFLGGWLVAFFSVHKDSHQVLTRVFRVDLQSASRFLTAWFYTWLVIVHIPVIWLLVKMVWMLIAFLLINGFHVPVRAFKEGWGHLVYSYSYVLVSFLISIPSYVRIQYFRLGVAREVSAQQSSL